MSALSLVREIAAGTGAKVPSLESVSPKLREMVAKGADLASKIREIQNEIRRVADQNAESYDFHGGQQDNAAASRIARLLGDPAPQPSEPASPKGQALLITLQDELKDLCLAAEMLGKRIDEEKRAASKIVCAQMRAEHEKKVRPVLAAVVALHKANVDYSAFADGMDVQRIAWGELMPAFPRFAGDPCDANSDLARYLFQALEDGWLKETDMPAEFRSRR